MGAARINSVEALHGRVASRGSARLPTIHCDTTMTFSRLPTFRADVPGYEDVALELNSLVSNYPPPFIYIHDPGAFKVTTSVVKDLLTQLASVPSPGPSSTSSGATKICIGFTDAICSFSQRLLFESLIHSLVDHDPAWEDGCADWDGSTGASGSSGSRS